MIYRSEDLDVVRCRPEYIHGAIEDLQWWGLDWDGSPVSQVDRLPLYRNALARLAEKGTLYASRHSRGEIRAASRTASPVDGEQIFPEILRTAPIGVGELEQMLPADPASGELHFTGTTIRFRVPDGRKITFVDSRTGQHAFEAGKDFGDFIVFRRDGIPAYELAVVVDDFEMGITEVVRGEDLLLSTARQLLLYEALGWAAPQWYHCPLVNDPSTGKRMSKTQRSLAIRELRGKGLEPGRDPRYYFQHLNLPG